MHNTSAPAKDEFTQVWNIEVLVKDKIFIALFYDTGAGRWWYNECGVDVCVFTKMLNMTVGFNIDNVWIENN